VISAEKIIAQNLQLVDIGSRIKKYRNNKMDPLVSIAKRREREYMTSGNS